MITCTLRDKKYSIDFVSGRALRELEPAAQMYAKVVRLSELAAKSFHPPPALATVSANLPMPVDTVPTPLTIFENTRIAGPAAAAMAANLIIISRWLSSSDMNFSSRSDAPSISLCTVGFRSSPMRCAASTAVFLRFFSLLSVVA